MLQAGIGSTRHILPMQFRLMAMHAFMRVDVDAAMSYYIHDEYIDFAHACHATYFDCRLGFVFLYLLLCLLLL